MRRCGLAGFDTNRVTSGEEETEGAEDVEQPNGSMGSEREDSRTFQYNVGERNETLGLLEAA